MCDTSLKLYQYTLRSDNSKNFNSIWTLGYTNENYC